jgi:hypothetical protein
VGPYESGGRSYDALGYYHKRRWLPINRWNRTDTVMDLWADSIVEISPMALSFLKYRDESEPWPEGKKRWPNLRQLIVDSEAFLAARSKGS